MRRWVVIIGIVGFWAVMMATLVARWLRQETVPGTYAGVLTPERRNSQQRMGIYWGGKRVGHTQTLLFCLEDGKYNVENDTYVTEAIPGLLPEGAAFSIHSCALVGADHSLARLSIWAEAEGWRAECRGAVVDGKLVLRPTLNGQRQEPVELPMPSGQMVGQRLSPLLAPKRLRPGMRWSFTMVDPFTLTPSQVDVRVLRHEDLDWEGHRVSTHVVEMRSGLFMVTRAWVGRDGEVYKQTLPFVTLIKEPIPEEEHPQPK